MIFIEIRCGYTDDDLSFSGPDKCRSTDNETPNGWAQASQNSVCEVYANLSREAKEDGWKLVKKTKQEGSYWICPACAKHRVTARYG